MNREHHQRPGETTAARRTTIAVVNPPTVLDVLDSLLTEGDYDVIVIDAADGAYSRIKETKPNLVVLCVDLDETDGCHVLSMLSLDADTSGIPVVTCLGPFRRSMPDLNMKEPDRLDRRASYGMSMN